jgi:hypothetical protein
MNARSEFINHVNARPVLCVHIQHGDDYDKPSVFDLTTGWTGEEWTQFLTDLDFEYDNGYGGQRLFGTIWYSDGTWSDRGEYDGSEWWEYNKCPNIPDTLKRIDKVRDNKLNQLGI